MSYAGYADNNAEGVCRKWSDHEWITNEDDMPGDEGRIVTSKTYCKRCYKQYNPLENE